MNKKKVLVFTSSGGGGHLSATAALEHYLNPHYDVQSVHIFKLLSHFDPIRVITFNKYSCEELFNKLLPKKYCKLITVISNVGTQYIYRRRKNIHKNLRDYCIQNKPELIISVIPIMNYIILDIAQELNIPFIVIPTDLNVTMYIQHIIKPTYKQFYIGLPFTNKELTQPIKKARISDEHIIILGAPLKADFFTHKNKDELKEQYAIDTDKPVIMILMGARGSCEAEKYTERLLLLKTPVQLIVCIGKHQKSKEKLERFIVPSHISMTVVEFTPHIADYMAMADILISKSGSQSVCEALYMNTPIFLDATSGLVPWEHFNHTFITKHKFGNQIKKYKQIVPRISTLLNHPEKLHTYGNNLEKLEKKDFEDELHKLLHKIFA